MSSSDIIDQVRRCIGDDEVKITSDEVTLEQCKNQKGVLPAVALLSHVIEANPEAIYSLSLEKWGCTNRDVEFIAPAIGKCKGLEYLSLSENEISEDGVRALVPALKECCELHTLLVDSNPLGHRGAALLAQVFPSLSALSILFMDNTDLSDKGADAVFGALPSAIKTVSFSGNYLSDASVKSLVRVLPTLPVISHLFLKHNEITDYGAKVISDVVTEKCPSMFSVALTSNSVTTAGSTYLIHKMSICPRCSFTFDEYKENEDIDPSLIKYSTFRVVTAVEAALNPNGENERAGSWHPLLADIDRMNELVKKAQTEDRDPVIAVLAEVLALHNDVKAILVSGLKLNRDDAALLGGAIGECPSLEEATFSRVNLLDGAVTELAEQLKKSSKLSRLRLSALLFDCSPIGTNEVDALASLLPQLKNLRLLALRAASGNEEFHRKIFDTLPSCRRLETFYYSGNHLSRESVALLQDTIRNSSITSVELKEANLTDDDALSFIALVERDPKVKSLSLEGNRFSQAGLAALRKASADGKCEYKF